MGFSGAFVNGTVSELTEHCSNAINDKPMWIIQWKQSFLNGSGTDPLKYIYIYKNNGDPGSGIPRHWHYVGFGLSDIHNYKFFYVAYETFRERDIQYKQSTQPLPDIYPPPYLLQDHPDDNGFGFELTFRLRCNSDNEWNQDPPDWPRKIMQDLARYVFQSRNTFSVGDHVAWHSPLDSDGKDGESSRIKHLLMTFDPQLGRCETSLGSVNFIQIVGVCEEELQAAREWNVRGILEIMREREETGGQYLVTNMRRGETIFELNPENNERLEGAIQSMGSDMAQISAKHKSSYTKPNWFIEAENLQNGALGEVNIEMDEDIFACRSDTVQDYPVRTPSRMSQGSESALKIEYAEFQPERYYQSIYILLSLESARVLPIMLNGRLAHRRTFSFQSFRGDSLITFQPEGCPQQTLVSPQHPFAKKGHWLQIYVSNELREQMYESIKSDFSRANFSCVEGSEEYQLRLPKNYSWPEFRLYLTVVKELGDD